MSWRIWQTASAAKRCLLCAGATLAAIVVVFVSLIAIELVAVQSMEMRASSAKDFKINDQLIRQGEYIATLGNCAACHSARGGEPFAGGKPIHTPFGAVYASNITPDLQHGIGKWSAEAFYRAMKHGVNAEGRLLTPAFPYTNYTHISRADSDALYAYFQGGVKPVAEPSKAHELGFPFNTQLALAVWRVLFFSPVGEVITPDLIAENQAPVRASSLNDSKKNFPNELERGRYLASGLGHCSACHAQRNALGAASSDGLLSGALMPMQDWYAPSLHAREEAGVQHWPREQIIAFLKNGATHNASALGPMAEVVAKSTQHWRDEDLSATAAYLQSLPVHAAPSKPAAKVPPQLINRGAVLYAQHCATCHAENGQGLQETDLLSPQGIVRIPSLAGNRAVSLPSSANLVRIILAGGYAPATAGNPRPYGMPPFVHVLTDDDIAAVTTYIRASWGNAADAVSASEVVAQRRGVLQ